MSMETERNEIVGRVAEWDGDVKARLWYESQPIPEFDGKTAQDMVEAGKSDIVRAYLDHIEVGGFA